jgi:hypothetical protein
MPFYLSGGTALGRYYLNHRFSDDLDFFVNKDTEYKKYIVTIEQQLKKSFQLDVSNSLVYDDFSRFYIKHDEVILKIEFINDIQYRCGNTKKIYFGEIDTPVNILSNKISMIVDRDEPKDIYDIIHIALNYKFNWREIFFETKKKAVINELDVERRLGDFPINWLSNVSWIKEKPEISYYRHCLKIIADDFILGKSNSLCNSEIDIFDAKPFVNR